MTRILVNSHNLQRVFDLLQEAGVRVFGGATIEGADPLGVVLIDDVDARRAVDLLQRMDMHARFD